MQTARVTFLTTPAGKAAIDAKAASLGVSSGEYIRLAVDNFDKASAEEEAELVALLEEVGRAVPAMQQSLDRSCAALDATHRKVDAFLREAGVRA